MEDRNLKNGELLIVQGQPDENIYRLKKGVIILYFSSHDLKLLDFIREDEFFGFSYLNNHFAPYCAESYGDSSVEIFDKNDLDFWIKNSYNDFLQEGINKVKKRMYESGISSEFDIIPFFRKVDIIDESFFSRFFAYQLVRKAIEYLESQDTLKKIDKGKYVFKDTF